MNNTAKRDRRRSIRVCRSAMTVEPRSTSWLTWWLLALLILAVFGIFAVRTEGVRQMLENRLQRRTGLDVAVGAARIGWPYELVLAAVVFEEKDLSQNAAVANRPLLTLDELRLGWRGRRGMHVTARNGRVTLRTGPDGRPQPAQWAPLADVEEAVPLTAWLEEVFGKGVRFRCEQVDIAWLDHDGGTIASAENVTLLSLPLHVPRRTWRFCELTVDRLYRVDGNWLAGLRHEWLVSGAAVMVQMAYRVAGEPNAAPGYGSE